MKYSFRRQFSSGFIFHLCRSRRQTPSRSQRNSGIADGAVYIYFPRLHKFSEILF